MDAVMGWYWVRVWEHLTCAEELSGVQLEPTGEPWGGKGLGRQCWVLGGKPQRGASTLGDAAGWGRTKSRRGQGCSRHLTLAVAQVLMAFGHFLLAMGWQGTMYVSMLLIGLGYGAHRAIVPVAVSELFGLKNLRSLLQFSNSDHSW